MVSIARGLIERLRDEGYVAVPLLPSNEMLRAGAVHCYQSADTQSEQTWKNAMADAETCYQIMIELGRL